MAFLRLVVVAFLRPPVFISECGFGGIFTTATMIRLAAASGSGDLGMGRSKKVWPKYDMAESNLLCALAVAIVNFNEFEHKLFQLFEYHLDKSEAPKRVAVKTYYEMTEGKRLNFIKIVFEAYEKEQAVKTTLLKLVKYFEWCADTRNKLAHARYLFRRRRRLVGL